MPRKLGHRVVSGLLSARKLPERPPSIPIGRPRGVKATGIRYQRAFERALLAEFPASGVEIGPWFRYSDASGHHHCQPDVLIYDIRNDSYVICEVKLTDYAAAAAQTSQLYVPVVEWAYDRTVARVVVLRHLTNVPPNARIYEDFRGAMLAADDNASPVVFHWLGKGPITFRGRP